MYVLRAEDRLFGVLTRRDGTVWVAWLEENPGFMAVGRSEHGSIESLAASVRYALALNVI